MRIAKSWTNIAVTNHGSAARQSEGLKFVMSEISELQHMIAKIRRERGFVTDPLKIQLLLTEEIGEISAELKRLWSINYDEFDPSRLSDEIADAFVLLSALASEFDIDIGHAVESKFINDDSMRTWKSADLGGSDSRSI